MYPLEIGSRIMVVGSTSAGKSTIARKLILHKKKIFPEHEPDIVIYCYNIWQNIYVDIMKLFPLTIFKAGLQSKDELKEIIRENNQHCLLFLDDMIHHFINNTDIERLITGYAHHYRVTTCIMTQNLYYHGKNSKTMTLSHGSFIPMASRTDTSQIHNFGRQVMGTR